MAEIEHELAPAELEVLRVLWDRGPSTVRQVLEELRRRGRRLAYTTVQTFLTRLEAKGAVASKRTGMPFVFEPRISREKMSNTRVRRLVAEFFDGAAGPLVLQLVRSERLSRDEIDELLTLIDSLDGVREQEAARVKDAARGKKEAGKRARP